MAKKRGPSKTAAKRVATEQSRTENATIKRVAAALRAAVNDRSLSALRILKPVDVALILGKSRAQLAEWRSQTRQTGASVGPPFMLAASGNTEGYPLSGLIDYIVRSTIWGSIEDHVMFALAIGEPGLDWAVTRFALSVLLPLADALDLPPWAEEREILLSEGWIDPAVGPDEA